MRMEVILEYIYKYLIGDWPKIYLFIGFLKNHHTSKRENEIIEHPKTETLCPTCFDVLPTFFMALCLHPDALR